MKIISFGVMEVEHPYIDAWGNANKVEVEKVSKVLTEKTVHLAEGFDGLTSQGITPVSESVYAALESFGIRHIAVRQVGMDNQDFEAAKRHNIAITNVPVYSPRAIAEMGLTHAMYLLRNIGEYRARMQAGDFRWNADTLSSEIFTKTVGLIGAGNIGAATAQIYSALGAHVLTYDVAYDPALEPYVTYADLNTVLKESDIVSLHVPLLPATKHIIDAKAISCMKDGAILINMSRGALIDTQALIDALKSHKLAGAGLDCLEDEAGFFGKQVDPSTLPKGYQELVAMPQVIMTPHVAFFTQLAVKNTVEIALNKTKAFIEQRS